MCKKHLAVIPKFIYVVTTYILSVSGEFERILHFDPYVEMLCIQFLERNKQFKDLHFDGGRRQAPLKLFVLPTQSFLSFFREMW